VGSGAEPSDLRCARAAEWALSRCGTARLRRIVKEHRIEETTVQYLTMNTTHQLVADHRAAVDATARRGRLRRMLSRTPGASTVELDLAAHWIAETSTPAVILRGAEATGTRVDKVA